MSKKLIVEIISALFILLFAYAGLSKLVDYRNFSYQLQGSPWTLLARLAWTMGWLLPAAELLLVIILMIPRTRTLGMYLSFITMLMFTAYIGILFTSGVPLPCTCGGILSKMSWSTHLIFNIFFSLLALAGIVLQKKDMRTSNNIHNSLA